MATVRLVDPDRANLLALFLRSILERRLAASTPSGSQGGRVARPRTSRTPAGVTLEGQEGVPPSRRLPLPTPPPSCEHRFAVRTMALLYYPFGIRRVPRRIPKVADQGDVLVEAGAMKARISFRPGEVVIDPDPGDAPYAARVKGSLGALFDACLGRRRLRNLASGRIEVQGSPWRLLEILRLLRA